jgi:hypothetical protein
MVMEKSPSIDDFIIKMPIYIGYGVNREAGLDGLAFALVKCLQLPLVIRAQCMKEYV